jgi:hypothetical protein
MCEKGRFGGNVLSSVLPVNADELPILVVEGAG